MRRHARRGACVEVYDGRVNDLLLPRADWRAEGLKFRCRARDDGTVGHCCADSAHKRDIGSMRDLLDAVGDAELNRSAAELPGAPGREVARGHLVVTVSYLRRWRPHAGSAAWEVSDRCSFHACELCPWEDPAEVGTLLAAAERQEGRPEDGAPPRRTRLREGEAINAALSAFAVCMRDARRGVPPDTDQSPLTRVLAGALRGGCVTIVACASPAAARRAESTRTLDLLELRPEGGRADRDERNGTGTRSSGPPHPLVGTQWSRPGSGRLTATLLGAEFRAAQRWMEEAKRGSEEVVEALLAVREVQMSDLVVTCFTEARRAYALMCGGEVFDLIDRNRDGSLSGHEVAAYLEAFPGLHERLAAAGARRLGRDWALLLTMLDRDGSGNLNVEEFCDFYFAGGLGPREEGAFIFEQADANKNGQLSCSELRTHLQANPELGDRMALAKEREIGSSWRSLLNLLVKKGSHAHINREAFAELWADSGLGAAPEGLGIASSFGQSNSSGELSPVRQRAVPGHRAHDAGRRSMEASQKHTGREQTAAEAAEYQEAVEKFEAARVGKGEVGWMKTLPVARASVLEGLQSIADEGVDVSAASDFLRRVTT